MKKYYKPKIKNISSCMKILKEAGYWIYGLEMKAGKSLKEIKFPKKVVIILYRYETMDLEFLLMIYPSP